MVTLDDLPNELVCEVLEEIWPQDLEIFAQTCRRMHASSKPLLVEHRKLIREYSISRDNSLEGNMKWIMNTLKKWS